MSDRARRLDELDALLARRAIEPLTAAETIRLEALEREFPSFDDGAYERAAAAVLLAVMPIDEPMPASLVAKLGGLYTGLKTDTAD